MGDLHDSQTGLDVKATSIRLQVPTTLWILYEISAHSVSHTKLECYHW